MVNTTAINTPGILGAYFFSPHISAIAPTPIASVGQWVSPTCLNTPTMSLIKDSLRGIDTPRTLDSCDKAITIAAALVKPTITGCDRKLTMTPSLNAPSAS